LRHKGLGFIAGIAKADPVNAINFDPDSSDMAAISPDIALAGIGLCCFVAHDHQAPDLGVPVYAGTQGHLSDAGFG
jgi:hypothetical protein